MNYYNTKNQIIKNKLFFFLIFFLFLLNACQGTKDALQGKTRADKSDEFLVEKKNPLSMPPDFNELPQPDGSNIPAADSKEEIKGKLNITSKREKDKIKKDNQSNTSLNSKILEKIKE